MQNRPGGEELIVGLDDPGAGGDGDTGLRKMLILCGMWIWPNEKGDFIYGILWLLYLSEYETWQVVKDYKGSKREDSSLVNCKIRIRGVPKSLAVATPHDPTYWNTQVPSKSYCASSKCHIRLSANTAQSLLWNWILSNCIIQNAEITE